MNAAEVAVLAALSPGGLLSATQIQRDAVLPGWRVRNALAQLQARGLVTPCIYRGRWQISERGWSALATKAKRFA
ncbi:hypothetical protein [Nocardia sp. NPDC052112]|uniref:hypothetical protein n=1 Tax=Nocardia sp. NPDC052112 TaxID=3155646 RepID=UPI003441BE8A